MSTISLAFEDAQRIFDLAVGADSACSGWMDSDDVAAMRRLAVALGVDPKECTGDEFVVQFPHAFVPGDAALDRSRHHVTERTPGKGAAWNITVRRPETDAEVIARLGGRPEEVCAAGRWKGRCGKPADDPIHADHRAAVTEKQPSTEVTP